jgi:hypothetical protein
MDLFPLVLVVIPTTLCAVTLGMHAWHAFPFAMDRAQLTSKCISWLALTGVVGLALASPGASWTIAGAIVAHSVTLTALYHQTNWLARIAPALTGAFLWWAVSRLNSRALVGAATVHMNDLTFFTMVYSGI